MNFKVQGRICVLLMLVLGLMACGKAQLTDAEHVNRAKEYLDDNEPRAAIIEFKNALSVNGDNMEARWLLGNAYVEMGMGESAEKELHRARELGVAAEAVQVSLAQSYLLQGKNSQVIAEIHPQGALSSKDKALIYALRGNAYLGEGKLDEAAKALQHAQELQADLVATQISQARLAIASDNLDEAKQWLDKALAAAPTSGEAWSWQGDLQRWQGDKVAAEQSYTRAIENRFNNRYDRYKRALTRIALENYAGADEDVQILKKEAPRQSGTHYAQGLIDFQQKNYPTAQIAFEEAIRVNPNYMPAVFYLGVTNYVQNHHEQAEQLLGRYLNAFPQSDMAAKLLATIHYKMRDYDRAELVAKPLLERNPDDVFALSLMANVAQKRGDTEAAIRYLQKVSGLSPESAVARTQLGLSLLMEGERRAGFKELQTAIDLDPQFHQADFLLAFSHLQARQFDQAIAVAQGLQEKQADSALAMNLIGLAYLGQGEIGKAKEAFAATLTAMPGDPSAALNLAALALKDKDFDAARGYYQAVLKQHPHHLQTQMRLVLMEVGAGNAQQAKALLEQVVRDNPQALEPNLLLAGDLLQQGRADQVLPLLADVQQLYPEHPGLLAIIGQAQLATQQLSNALVTFRKLAQLQPSAAQPHYLLSQAYAELNDVDNTRLELRSALELEPNHVPAKLALVRLLTLQGELAKAGTSLNELKGQIGEHPQVIMLQAELAMAQGRPKQAVVAFQRVLELAPSSQVVTSLAQALWQAGDPAATITTLKHWLDDHAEDVNVRYVLASFYIEGQHLDQARTELGNVVKQAPQHAAALNDLAWIIREQEPEQALQYARQAATLAPGVPGIMDTLAMILLEQGQHRKALDLLQQAAAKAGANPTIRYHLALALVKNGDEPAARKLLKELLQRQHFAERSQAESLLQSLGG